MVAMAGRSCCVRNCRRRSHDHLGRKIPNRLSFHCFPAWRTNEGAEISALTRRRRAAWVAAVSRSSISFNLIPKSMRVCSRHFHSGKPAYEMLESDPDWIPSLYLGHSDERTRRAECPSPSTMSGTQGCGTDAEQDVFNMETAREGSVRTSVLPWSEIRSVLQSVLRGKVDTRKKPEDGTRGQPGNNTDVSFTDFFRNSLEASLEASSWSRAQSQTPASAPQDFYVDLNCKASPLRERIQTPSTSVSSSSSCLNCVRLQTRIEELEEKLFDLTAKRQDTETPVPQSPGPVHTEQDRSGCRLKMKTGQSECTEPLCPPQELLRDGDQDMDESLPSCRRKFRGVSRFNPAWLKMFWFLRYSASLDQMWCHVCRIHADDSCLNLSLIKGSRSFKVDSIKKHSRCLYHKKNVKRYKAQASSCHV